MKFNIRNQAKVPNKYIRYIKWKMRKIHSKFQSFIYSEIHISKEGTNHGVYSATIKLGVKGQDIILKEQSTDMKTLCRQIASKIPRRIRKMKEQRQPFR